MSLTVMLQPGMSVNGLHFVFMTQYLTFSKQHIILCFILNIRVGVKEFDGFDRQFCGFLGSFGG